MTEIPTIFVGAEKAFDRLDWSFIKPAANKSKLVIRTKRVLLLKSRQ